MSTSKPSHEPSPGYRLIEDLRSFFFSSGHHSLLVDRPTDWHCVECNVWGRAMPPAACWCCGSEDVDYRVAPSMSGSHRFHPSPAHEGV